MMIQHKSGGVTTYGSMIIGVISVLTMIITTLGIPIAQANPPTRPGALGSPSDSSLGGLGGASINDTGVATWVGRDMYISGKPKNTHTLDDSTDIPGSYAVEAEGLTIVNGKLALNPIKPSWSKNGFRFGAAGFGSQIRPNPADGTKTALAVADVNSGITILKTGRNGVDADHPTASVGAWAYGGFVGNGMDKINGVWKPADNLKYNALLSGPFTTIKDNTDKDSIVGQANSNNSIGDNTLVKWNQPNVLKDINGVDYTSYQNTGHDYSTYIQSLSNDLSGKTVNGNTTIGTAPSGDYWRNKYNKNDIRYKFIFNDAHKEKLITFTGDGVKVDDKYVGSKMQVFTVKASDLSSDGYSGISYRFDNIPSGASVVVNVVNDDGSPVDSEIDFHNGWRFWWNGLEIGNGYTEYVPNNPDDPVSAETHTAKSKAYGVASRSIMWNFGKSPKVVIRGGTYNDQVDSNQDVNEDGDLIYDQVNESATGLGDDPAAAILGTVMTAYGEFESHVTTNGRVFTGSDFFMYNPVGIKQFTGANTDNSWSASVLDMDQERHNFPWFGLSESYGTITWDKVDGNGDPVNGTSWAIYNTLDAAINREESGLITRITDNDASDWDPRQGSFKLEGLVLNGEYYLVEWGNAPSSNGVDYEENTNIYQIITGDKPGVYSTINRVYSSSGGDPGDDMLLDGKIVNKIAAKDNNVNWGKYVEGDRSERLAGTSWNLKGPDGVTHVIDDLVTKVVNVVISNESGQTIASTKTPGSIEMASHSVQLHGNAELDNEELTNKLYHAVKWTSSDDSIALVDDSGRVWSGVNADGTKSAVIKASSVLDGSIAAEVTVTPPAVTGLVIRDGSGAIVNDTTMRLSPHTTVALTVDPDNPAVAWESRDNTVATVSQDGVVTAVSDKVGQSTIITAKFGSLTANVTITIVPVKRDVTVYIRGDAYVQGKTGVKFDPNDLYMGYCIDSCSGAWNTVKTTPNPTYTGYNSVTLADVSDGSQVSFYFQDSKGEFLNRNYTNVENFTFKVGEGTGATTSYTVSQGNDYYDGTPKIARARSINKSDPESSVIIDVNPNGGLFTIRNLKPGSYELSEASSPDGFTVNPTKYTFTVNANGTVKWGDPSPEYYDGLHWMENTRASVQWDKVDSTDGVMLDGSKWRLQMRSADGGWTDKAEISDCVGDCPYGEYLDMDSNKGGFSIEGLVSGEYRLVETVAPDGYDLDGGTYYYFTIRLNMLSTDKVTLRKGDGNGPHDPEVVVNGNKITNDRREGSISWMKVSSEDEDATLAGSEWTLKNTDTGETMTIRDCVVAGSAEDRTCGGSELDRDPDAGVFKVDGLDWGVWELVETVAPNGFQISPDKFTATIGGGDSNVVIDIDLGRITNDPIRGSINRFPLTGMNGTMIVLLIVVLTAGAIIVIRRGGKA